MTSRRGRWVRGAVASELGRRRPIKARNFAWSQALARGLAARGVSPNGISIVGLLCAIVAGALLGLTDGTIATWLLAALCVELRLLCNMFDGMVALERGIASKMG